MSLIQDVFKAIVLDEQEQDRVEVHLQTIRASMECNEVKFLHSP